jgi:WD40 repeat protein/transcriptional regulator with XRE-family HTH domain
VASKRQAKPNDDIGRRLLALRTLSGLTQVQLADRLGVSKRSILNWESGAAYPTEAHLRHLIETFVAQQAFTSGQEQAEAQALWEQISQTAGKPLPAFPALWFAQLLAGVSSQQSAVSSQQSRDSERRVRFDLPSSILDPRSSPGPLHPFTPSPLHPLIDWGEALDVPALYGREAEQATLQRWVLADRCRTVALLGLGGIGKTSLALMFARQALPNFEAVLFRSLRNAPPPAEVFDQLIRAISTEQTTPPDNIHQKIALLIQLLRERRCLLVLDNLETIIQEGAHAGEYRSSYAEYGTLIQRIGESTHQSCLILTSREKPAELALLEGPTAPVRSLMLAGLKEQACQTILAEKAVFGPASVCSALVQLYGGNPLALKLISEPIREVFGGDVQAFLDSGDAFFNGVGKLLKQQFERLTPLEQALLFWLALERELVSLDSLLADLVDGTPQRAVLAALESLRRRSLVERGDQGATFTLQPVVLEYLIEEVVVRSTTEILAGQPALLQRYALVKALSKDYVRHSQEQLIAGQLLEQLVQAYGDAGALERQLLTLLETWRDRPPIEQGYGPGNVINLLRLLRGNLRGLDLARLAIRQAYLQGVEIQDTSLAGAMIQDSVFTETFDSIMAVAISSTGEYWAASSRRGEIRLWVAGGQTLRRAWRAHADMIWTIEFSPDGRMLASGSWDGTLKLWDVASGVLFWEGRHTSRINRVMFAPDGGLLASTGNDATVRLWDLRSGRQLQTLPHPAPLAAIIWSPDGRLLASGDVEGYIRLWEIHKNQPATCVQTFAAHTHWVDDLVFAPEASILASASWDGTVKLWDLPSGALRQTLTGHTDRVLRVAWSPDGRTLASGSRDQTIRLWDVEQSSYRAALQGHSAGVYGLAFTPGNHTLLSGSEDGTLRAWEVASGQCMRVMQGYAAFLYVLDWSPDGTQLVSGGTDKLVMIWDASGETPPRALRGHGGVVSGVGWSPDSRLIASSEWDNAIRLWDPASGVCVQILQHDDDAGNCFYDLSWSPDGQWLASGTNRRALQMFEMAMHRHRWAEHQFPTLIRHVAWSPQGAWLAGGGDDGSVYVWNHTDGGLPQRLAGHHSMITSLAWSAAGTRLASASGGKTGGELFVWEPQSGERIQTFAGHPGIVSAVAWGPGEELLVSGDGDGVLRWWHLPSGECVRVHTAHQGTVQSLKRSPDGTKLASCGDDGAIMLWDLHTGAHLRTLRRDRPYERMHIGGLVGITEAQRATLLALGAVGF